MSCMQQNLQRWANRPRFLNATFLRLQRHRHLQTDQFLLLDLLHLHLLAGPLQACLRERSQLLQMLPISLRAESRLQFVLRVPKNLLALLLLPLPLLVLLLQSHRGIYHPQVQLLP